MGASKERGRRECAQSESMRCANAFAKIPNLLGGCFACYLAPHGEFMRDANGKLSGCRQDLRSH